MGICSKEELREAVEYAREVEFGLTSESLQLGEEALAADCRRSQILKKCEALFGIERRLANQCPGLVSSNAMHEVSITR